MKNRSELREVIVKVIYQTIILEEAKLEYNVNDLIKEQLEVQNEFVDSCVHGILENKSTLSSLANNHVIAILHIEIIISHCLKIVAGSLPLRFA